jgi:sugar phosphate isomerase/epimerase
VFVAASTECFPNLALDAALQRLVDLEYTKVEVCIREEEGQLRPSHILSNLDAAVTTCRDLHRLTPISYALEMDPEGPNYYAQFTAICRLAKATKVVTLTVPSAEIGTPFNAEVERLRELVRIATLDGVLVGLKTEVGRMTQDPNTAAVLCDQVKGLGLTLDPSHYVFGPFAGVDYDHLMKYVCHVQLRDTSKTQLQVRVGQGEVEYGRLISQLAKVKYNRALCVHISDQVESDVDHAAEMRKIRLLLESLP